MIVLYLLKRYIWLVIGVCLAVWIVALIGLQVMAAAEGVPPWAMEIGGGLVSGSLLIGGLAALGWAAMIGKDKLVEATATAKREQAQAAKKAESVKRESRPVEVREARLPAPIKPVFDDLDRTIVRLRKARQVAEEDAKHLRLLAGRLTDMVIMEVVRAKRMERQSALLVDIRDGLAAGERVDRQAAQLDDRDLRALLLAPAAIVDAGYWAGLVPMVDALQGRAENALEIHRQTVALMLAEVTRTKVSISAIEQKARLAGYATPVLSARAQVEHAEQALTLPERAANESVPMLALTG